MCQNSFTFPLPRPKLCYKNYIIVFIIIIYSIFRLCVFARVYVLVAFYILRLRYFSISKYLASDVRLKLSSLSVLFLLHYLSIWAIRQLIFSFVIDYNDDQYYKSSVDTVISYNIYKLFNLQAYFIKLRTDRRISWANYNINNTNRRIKWQFLQ